MTKYPLPQPISKWAYGMTVVPSSPATINSGTVTLNKMFLSNVTTGAVTVTVTDGSTEASGSPCQIFPAVSVPANSIMVVDLGGVVANSGVAWSASASASIHGYMDGGN